MTYYEPFREDVNDLLPKDKGRVVKYGGRLDPPLGYGELPIIHDLRYSHQPTLKWHLQ